MSRPSFSAVDITFDGNPLRGFSRDVSISYDAARGPEAPVFPRNFSTQMKCTAISDLDKLARVLRVAVHATPKCTIVQLPPVFKVKRGQKRSARDRRRARVEAARRVEIVFETDADLRESFLATRPEIAGYFRQGDR